MSDHLTERVGSRALAEICEERDVVPDQCLQRPPDRPEDGSRSDDDRAKQKLAVGPDGAVGVSLSQEGDDGEKEHALACASRAPRLGPHLG
jgi:hypothetical protein